MTTSSHDTQASQAHRKLAREKLAFYLRRLKYRPRHRQHGVVHYYGVLVP